MAAAAKSNLKRVSLELGGKSPLIIFADTDCKCCFLIWQQQWVLHLPLYRHVLQWTMLQNGPMEPS